MHSAKLRLEFGSGEFRHVLGKATCIRNLVDVDLGFEGGPEMASASPADMVYTSGRSSGMDNSLSGVSFGAAELATGRQMTQKVCRLRGGGPEWN